MKKLLILFLASALWACTQQSNKPVAIPEVNSIKSPTTAWSGMPHFSKQGDRVLMSWIEKLDSGGHSLNYAEWKNDAWLSPVEIARGENWFVNWADFPSIILFNDGRMAAHWLAKSGEGTFHYDVWMRFFDAEKWLEPFILNTDGLKAEHGFASMAAFDDGRLLISWLDGRNTVSDEAHAAHGHDHSGEMSLRAAIFNSEFERVDDWELDSRVCDCCQTSLAISGHQALLWYRDRSEEEIRDISMMHYKNGEWSASDNFHPDQWKIAGCPVNGPSSTWMDNTCLAAWYAMEDEQPKVRFKLAGANLNFGAAQTLNDNPGPGRVHTCAIPERNSFGIVWMETQSGNTQIQFAEIDAKSGEVKIKFPVVSASSARASGFPRLIWDGKQILLAYTNPGELNQLEIKSFSLD